MSPRKTAPLGALQHDRRNRGEKQDSIHRGNEVVANKEVEAALKELIRKGRGRFVDVH